MEELLQELIAKVYEVNQKTEHSLFLNFSGHVNLVEVHYYKNGWSNEKRYESLSRIHLNEKLSELELEQTIKKLSELLKGVEDNVG